MGSVSMDPGNSRLGIVKTRSHLTYEDKRVLDVVIIGSHRMLKDAHDRKGCLSNANQTKSYKKNKLYAAAELRKQSC